MELDIEVCRAVAIQNGLPLQFVVKEFYLMDALSQAAAFLSSHPDSLVFKGGTALNKVYLQKPQRFSEDLDFDLVTKGAKKDLPKFCKSLAGSMRGYEIAEFRKVRGTMQFYCVYESPLGGKDHVRIDIAPKKLLTARPLELKPAVSGFTHASVAGFKVYSIEDLTARKLNALATRTEGKDVYDVHSALPLCALPVLKKAVALMLESEGRDEGIGGFLRKALSALGKSDPKKLRNLTNPFIPLAHRPKDWLELKNDLIIKLEEIGG